MFLSGAGWPMTQGLWRLRLVGRAHQPVRVVVMASSITKVADLQLTQSRTDATFALEMDTAQICVLAYGAAGTVLDVERFELYPA